MMVLVCGAIVFVLSYAPVMSILYGANGLASERARHGVIPSLYKPLVRYLRGQPVETPLRQWASPWGLKVVTIEDARKAQCNFYPSPVP